MTWLLQWPWGLNEWMCVKLRTAGWPPERPGEPLMVTSTLWMLSVSSAPGEGQLRHSRLSDSVRQHPAPESVSWNCDQSYLLSTRPRGTRSYLVRWRVCEFPRESCSPSSDQRHQRRAFPFLQKSFVLATKGNSVKCGNQGTNVESLWRSKTVCARGGPLRTL